MPPTAQTVGGGGAENDVGDGWGGVARGTLSCTRIGLFYIQGVSYPTTFERIHHELRAVQSSTSARHEYVAQQHTPGAKGGHDQRQRAVNHEQQQVQELLRFAPVPWLGMRKGCSTKKS